MRNWLPWSRSEHSGEGTPQADLRLVWPAIMAWICAWGGTSSTTWAKTCLVMVTAVMLVIGWHHQRAHPCQVSLVLVIALIGGLALASGWSAGYALRHSAPAVWAGVGRAGEMEVLVSADTRWYAGHGRYGLTRARLLTVDLPHERWTGDLSVLLWHREPMPEPGSRIRLGGHLARPGDDADLVGVVRTDGTPEVVQPPPWGAVAVNRFRSALRDSMSTSEPDAAGLVPSLVVGDTGGLPAELTTIFRATGLSHLTAVSGMNLSLVLVFVLTVARTVGVTGWGLRATAIVSALAFVVVCQNEPSILRAAAMGTVAVVGTGLGPGRQRTPRQLALVVIVLLIAQPWLCRSWGFALSVSACAGIVWWGQRWVDLLATWLPSWLAEPLGVTLAAQIATQPLVTLLSGRIALVGVFANLTATPFVAPVTIMGLAAGGCYLLVPGVGRAVGWCAGVAAQPIIWTARRLAGLPAAQVAWPTRIATMVLLVAICWWLVAWFVPRVIAHRGTGALTALVLIVVIIQAPSQPGWPNDWRIIACDVGQGSALLIRVDEHSAVLVDTGPEPRLLERCLSMARINHLAMIVLTHGHADHVTGMTAIDPGQVDAILAGTPATIAWLDANISPELGARARLASSGENLVIGDVVWETIGSTVRDPVILAGEGESSAENDASVAAIVTTPTLSLLVTGDQEEAGQEALDDALRSRAYPAVDVFLVPHHGSARHSARLFGHVHARMALISVGQDNDYGHPAAGTLSDLHQAGMQVFRTDQHGVIAVRESGQEVVTQR